MPNNTAGPIGSNVRAEMARRGISQARLAAELAIPQSSLSDRLRGNTAFKIDELIAIARLFDVSIDTLLDTTVGGAA